MKHVLSSPVVASVTFLIGVMVVLAIGSLFIKPLVKAGDNVVAKQVEPKADPQAARDTDTLDIYSVLLEKYRNRGSIIVSEMTSQGWAMQGNFNRNPSASPETVADFKARNATPTRLDLLFENKPEVVRWDEKKNSSIFSRRDTDGWQEFHKQYPGAAILRFSNVGFNAARDQALVYFAESCGSLCGQGSLIVLAKIDGRWTISSQENLWLS
jgi:hypothetical protein